MEIKTWQERRNWPEYFAPGYDGMPAWEAAKAEIAELRAALAISNEALMNIRKAGYNFTNWAVWAQKTAAWGMDPKWPKQPESAPCDD